MTNKQPIVYIDLGVGGMTCDECVVHVTEALESVPGVEEARVDLATRSAVVVARPDEGDPIDGVVGIRPIARRRPARRGQQPDLLVVANGGGGEARSACEFSDAHDRMIDLLTLKRT